MAADELELVLRSLRGVVDGEEPVDEFAHALLCAANARAAGSDDALIAAALLHDVGRSPIVIHAHPDAPHELAAARWLRPRLGERVAWLAGAHVAAKLHLLETEPGYGDLLSAESAKTAVLQRAHPAVGFLEHPWWRDAVKLRRFDDAAKDPSAALPDADELLEIVRAVQQR